MSQGKLITLEDGREFPLFKGEPLSWSSGLYMTNREEKAGYQKALAVLRCSADIVLMTERQEMLKASSDRIFGHNAKKHLVLIDRVIRERTDTRLRLR